MPDQTRKKNLDVIHDGDTGILLSRVVIPQFFIFVSIVILGVFNSQLQTPYLSWVPSLGFPLLILYTSAVAINFLSYFLIRGFAARISSLVLSVQLVFLSLVLIIGSNLLNLDLGPQVFVPISLAICLIPFCTLRLSSILNAVLPAVFLFSALVFRIILIDGSQTILPGYVMLLGAFFVSLILGWLRSINLGSGKAVLDPFIGQASDHSDVSETQGVTAHLLGRITTEFRWRFFPLCLVMAVNSLALGIYNQSTSIGYYAIWIVLVSVQVILFSQSRLQSSLFNLQLLWSVGVASLILLWLHPFASGFAHASSVEIGFLLIMLTLGMMPWTWQFNFANTLGFIILGGILSWHSDALILSAAVYLFLAFYLLFRNSRNLIAFCNSTIIQPFLMQLRGIRDSKSIADLLAESVVLATDSSGCLILIGRNQEWELTGLGENLDDKDRFLIADFGVSLKEQNSRCKVLPITEINRLFHPFLDSWFGFLPSRVVYFSVALKTNLGMESISGLVPVSPTLRLADWNQVQRSICSLLELAESGGDTIRRASKGTHTFISPFRSDLNQDEELGEVIHHVNNAAQDLSVVSESITKQFQSLSEMSFEQQDRIRAQALSDQIKQHVINLSETIRYLSTSVSDIRWLKEASHSPVPEKLESVNLREILEDVSSYALFKLRRSGALVKLTASQEDLGNIQVESREFLEALLRAVLRIAGRGLKKESSCVISDLSGVDVSGIRLTFSGISHNSFYDIFGGSRDEEVLRTLRRFVDNSRGTLLLEKSSIIPEAADISLSFRNVDRKVSAPQVVGGWALLIDDKPEIVNFYGSVAEALGLKCGAATNLTEARNLLNERDLPNIVVTDIQLDQENGLDFVREVRDRHGLAVPIIVVSGNTEEHIRAQVFSAGATKYLTKPVGRRKLFLEIKDLLGKR